MSACFAASGKNLTTIYVAHGHGDHFFGLPLVLERFPRAKAVATRAVVEAMRAQLAPESMALGRSARRNVFERLK